MSDKLLIEINILIEEFKKISKRILQNRPLSTNPNKIKEYADLLIENYNSIVKVCQTDCDLTGDKQNLVPYLINNYKRKLSQCFEKLNYDIEIPLEVVKIETLNKHMLEEFSDAQSEVDIQTLKRCTSEQKLNKFLKLDQSHFSISTPDISFVDIKHDNELTMATLAQKREVISMCANIIRNNYDGNPLALESFIDKLNLIEGLTDQTLLPTFIAFILSKLEGKARESVPQNITSILEIKTGLRNKIKPDNSKVVAGIWLNRFWHHLILKIRRMY